MTPFPMIVSSIFPIFIEMNLQSKSLSSVHIHHQMLLKSDRVAFDPLHCWLLCLTNICLVVSFYWCFSFIQLSVFPLDVAVASTGDGLTVSLGPGSWLSERPAGCERHMGRWGWGWGWAAWPRTGCSWGPLPGWAGGHLSGPCSSEPTAPPRRMCPAPSSWHRATVGGNARHLDFCWQLLRRSCKHVYLNCNF